MAEADAFSEALCISCVEAEKKNIIYTIECTYGYALEGELDAADLLIDDIRELLNYL